MDTAEQVRQADEALHYLGQMLDSRTMRVISEACAVYATTTLGADRSIAEQVAGVMSVA